MYDRLLELGLPKIKRHLITHPPSRIFCHRILAARSKLYVSIKVYFYYTFRIVNPIRSDYR